MRVPNITVVFSQKSEKLSSVVDRHELGATFANIEVLESLTSRLIETAVQDGAGLQISNALTIFLATIRVLCPEERNDRLLIFLKSP